MSAKLKHVYKDDENRIWSCEGFWKHPEYREYHKNWAGEYVILQEYGNFKNPIQLVLIEEFDSKFTLTWEPLKLCKFCGFSRMHPCLTRQACPNLGP